MAAKNKAKKNTSPKAKQKPAAKKAAPPVKKGPRQTSLPGMEDRAIKALDDAALSYAEVRDQRIAFSQSEGEAKKQLLGLMHAHKKKSYRHNNIAIEIVPEGEKLKVKIKEQGSDEPGDPGQTVEEEEVVVDAEFEDVETEEPGEEEESEDEGADIEG